VPVSKLKSEIARLLVTTTTSRTSGLDDGRTGCCGFISSITAVLGESGLRRVSIRTATLCQVREIRGSRTDWAWRSCPCAGTDVDRDARKPHGGELIAVLVESTSRESVSGRCPSTGCHVKLDGSKVNVEGPQG